MYPQGLLAICTCDNFFSILKKHFEFIFEFLKAFLSFFLLVFRLLNKIIEACHIALTFHSEKV